MNQLERPKFECIRFCKDPIGWKRSDMTIVVASHERKLNFRFFISPIGKQTHQRRRH